MKKFFLLVRGGLSILIPFFLIYGEVAGIVHSVRHHSKGDIIACIFLPPLAWYRSIEMYWHKDYPNVNWNKQLDSDLRTCIYFYFQASDKGANVFQLNEDMITFSNSINTYPKDKRQFLVKGCREFISYCNHLIKDYVSDVNNYLSTGNFTFNLSSTTKELETDLINNYKLNVEVETLKNEIISDSKQQTKSDSRQYTQDERKTIEEEFKSYAATINKRNDDIDKRFFETIFNQKL